MVCCLIGYCLPDPDRDFLLRPVQHGILPLPDSSVLQPFAVPNYTSALEEAARVSAGLDEEVQQGWVIPVPPAFSAFVHPLGVVPKPDGGIRVIHDHSVPLGQSLNDHQVYLKLSYDSLEATLPFLVPHVFMARLDISAYYRHFMIHPGRWQLQAFVWEGQMYVDGRLQFGARTAPEIATGLLCSSRGSCMPTVSVPWLV
jgi:hypothetical protein